MMKPSSSSTHDISSVNFHVRDLATFGETLTCATAAAFPSKRSRYTQVQVLLISWEEDVLEVSKEISELQYVFQRRYHYDTEWWRIPGIRSHNSLVRRLTDFLAAYEDRQTLLIVYYAGHGRLNNDRQLIGACHDNADSPTIQWLGIQNMLEQADSDVLILLDCCCGASSAAEAGNGVTEVIAACGFETWAPGVGEHSFTRSLIDELDFWNLDASHSVAMLHMRILSSMKHARPRTWNGRSEEQRKTPIYSVLTNEGESRSIELKPLSPGVRAVELPTSSMSSTSSATTDLNHPLTQSALRSLGRVWPDHEFKYPKVLISLALDEDQWLSTGAWTDWLSLVPAVAKSAQVEGIYKSDSTLVLLSLSVAVWDMLPEDPAVRFLGFVRSNNLMNETTSLARDTMMELAKKHSKESPGPESLGPSWVKILS